MSTLNNIIVMNRGDSLLFQPNIEVFGEYADYVLTGDDTLYFGLMDPGHYFENALVRKRYDSEDLKVLRDFKVELDPEDTLDLLPGKYFYALKLHLCHTEVTEVNQQLINLEVDKVITLINKTKFIIND